MIELDQQTIAELKQLERSLWIAETRFDHQYMDKVLSPDFFEFGRSGRVYRREDTLAIENEDNIQAQLKNFKFHPIAVDVVLVTYISEVQYDELEIANRSSLWLKTPDGWQLQFHQGTPVQSL